MRRIVKRGAERFLRFAGPAAVSRRSHRGRGLVLAYHNIVPDGETASGDASLHLSQRRFAEQLDQLLDEGVHVGSLEEVVGAGEVDRSRPLRRVAITFDDAYRGAVHAGVEELVRRGLPATIFVVPGLLGDVTFWWDALSATESGPMSPATRETALLEARGRNDEVLRWARSKGLSIGTVPAHARSADEDEVLAAAAHAGIDLASHTWSHGNLTALSEEECRDELARAVNWLNERSDGGAGWMSYPYGLYDPVAAEAAAAAGHRGAFRIEGGWLPRPRPLDAFRLPRLNVPAGLTSDGFKLRLAGLLCG